MTACLLTIMGSGETSPTMVSTHRDVFAALEPEVAPAVVVDTSYGFQENADEITTKAAKYFAVSVDRRLEAASLRSFDAADAGDVARFEADLRAARFVFAGPGSPTYALEQWHRTQLAPILVDKLRHGGAVTFASAAAVTLGKLALPVYEIYKAGRSPHWVEGLDVLGALGIDAVVIPHFDNAEGGTHDTRYCFMGRRRLEMLEDQLPPATSVIGVDEHTACVIDLARGELRVTGKGGLTVRRDGHRVLVPAGASAPLATLRGEGAAPMIPTPATDTRTRPVVASLDSAIEEAQQAFAAAEAGGDAAGAAGAILGLEQALADWSADPLESDAPDRARSLLRTLVVRLGDAAGTGMMDRRTRLGPYVDMLVELRSTARDRGDWETADTVRDRLAALGIELRDGVGRTEWVMRDP